ncbi:MAG: hypothetical protein NZM04_03940 [Methylacidiphilales bacterium]|nr:hypothetical protein [Candidatus Methylacidiphilales bacterium]
MVCVENHHLWIEYCLYRFFYKDTEEDLIANRTRQGDNISKCNLWLPVSCGEEFATEIIDIMYKIIEKFRVKALRINEKKSFTYKGINIIEYIEGDYNKFMQNLSNIIILPNIIIKKYDYEGLKPYNKAKIIIQSAPSDVDTIPVLVNTEDIGCGREYFILNECFNIFKYNPRILNKDVEIILFCDKSEHNANGGEIICLPNHSYNISYKIKGKEDDLLNVLIYINADYKTATILTGLALRIFLNNIKAR